ncbi:hypothetical protein BX600DRAFT_159173 [Xylariales sp. PMI_506]|nr:hypothetical protein BX600DRAFT_159173 [Xylariales sp. PMI_506]
MLNVTETGGATQRDFVSRSADHNVLNEAPPAAANRFIFNPGDETDCSPSLYLYHILLDRWYMNESPRRLIQERHILGTYTSLAVAQAAIESSLLMYGCTVNSTRDALNDPNRSEDVQIQESYNIVDIRGSNLGPVLHLHLFKTANSRALKSINDSGILVSGLWHVIQTKIAPFDSQGKDTIICGTFNMRLDAQKFGSRLLYDQGCTDEEFLYYRYFDSDENAPEDIEAVIVHAVDINGTQYLVSVLKQGNKY